MVILEPLERLLHSDIRLYVGLPNQPEGLEVSVRPRYSGRNGHSQGTPAYMVGPSDSRRLKWTFQRSDDAPHKVTSMGPSEDGVLRLVLDEEWIYEIHSSKETLPKSVYSKISGIAIIGASGPAERVATS